MGYDICWNQHGECEPLPKEFEARWVGRQKFQSVIWNYELLNIKICGCGEKCNYFCDEAPDSRPANAVEFMKWRDAIEKDDYFNDVNKEIFLAMIDYLERNPNMYLNFSC